MQAPGDQTAYTQGFVSSPKTSTVFNPPGTRTRCALLFYMSLQQGASVTGAPAKPSEADQSWIYPRKSQAKRPCPIETGCSQRHGCFQKIGVQVGASAKVRQPPCPPCRDCREGRKYICMFRV